LVNTVQLAPPNCWPLVAVTIDTLLSPKPVAHAPNTNGSNNVA
jgi:hypothetical protein